MYVLYPNSVLANPKPLSRGRRISTLIIMGLNMKPARLPTIVQRF
jgi:hypothetical protein